MEKNIEWFVGEVESDDGRIVTRGRMFRTMPDKKTYKMRVEIIWRYKPDRDSMPLPNETVRMDDAMNSLCETMEEDRLAWQTAIHIGGGCAVFVYYTRDIDAFSGRLDKTLGKYSPLPIQVGAALDPSWHEYKEMLSRFSLT